MIHEKSLVEKITIISMPFLAFLIAIFANFVQFGLKKPNTNWYWQIVINILVMLCFWMPGKSFAIQKAIKSATIITLKENFTKQVQQYYDKQERKMLREYLKEKHKIEVEEYIANRLVEAEVEQEDYVKKYKNNNKAVRKSVKDRTITKKQGKLLLSANKFSKIKAIEIDDIIPNIIKQSFFKKNFNTFKTASKVETLKKVGKIAMLGFAISLIFVNPTQKDNAMAIALIIFLKMLSSVFSLVSGIFTGRYLIMEKYAQDLASKTDELDEFHASEFCGKTNIL